MSIRLAACLAACLAAGPAFSGSATTTRDIEGVTLHEGALDMVVYYRSLADGALEVTATFLARDSDEPKRVVMALAEGDDVAFALPGHPEAVYRFARAGAAVTVSVSPAAKAGS